MIGKIFALLLAAACTTAGAQKMEAGEWRFQTDMSSVGMAKSPATTFTRCVKPRDARDPGKLLGTQEQKDCQVTKGPESAGTFAWETSCPKSGMTGKGTVRYSARTLESEMQSSIESQGRKIDMTTRTVGNRIGPCVS